MTDYQQINLQIVSSCYRKINTDNLIEQKCWDSSFYDEKIVSGAKSKEMYSYMQSSTVIVFLNVAMHKLKHVQAYLFLFLKRNLKGGNSIRSKKTIRTCGMEWP